jgi:hypothetical protein
VAFVSAASGRIASAEGDPAQAVATLLGAILTANHLGRGDVLAAVIRGPAASARLVAAVRAAGVAGVPVFAAVLPGAGALELTLHVRLTRRRRLHEVALP